VRILLPAGGRIRERAGFRSLDEIPSLVLAARRAGRAVAGSELGGDRSGLPRRLEYSRPPSSTASLLAMRQVIRLNLRHFLTRLDEPVQTVPHYDPELARFGIVRLDPIAVSQPRPEDPA
jgi:hypothetical protein